MSRVQQIKDLDEAIHILEYGEDNPPSKQVRFFVERGKSAKGGLRGAMDEMETELLGLLAEEMADLTAQGKVRYAFTEDDIDGLEDPEYVMPVTWDCESEDNPFGFCVYDDENDPCHDRCVFCGQPEERK